LAWRLSVITLDDKDVIMQTDPCDWLLLAQLPKVGAVHCKQLFDAGYSATTLIHTPELWQSLNFSPASIELLQALGSGKGVLAQLKQQMQRWRETPQNYLISLGDPNYPSLLYELPDPPPFLCVRGNLEALHLPQIALVGSRKASRSGVLHAARLAGDLSRAGLVITSGLAYGIDAAAHQAAVQLHRSTLAVMGTGLDRIYPASHRLLAGQILEAGGAWISEHVPGTKPLAHHFPRRNRLISGLSVGVIVVEAALKSGSLITARTALEQSREVFALPGAPDHIQAQGCHQLIRNGATLVTEAAHVVEHLAPLLGHMANIQSAPSDKATKAALSGEQAVLLKAIDYTPCPLDLLSARLNKSVAELSVALLELEIEGLIEAVGDAYRRV
jgi:DNA processing protein